MFRPVAVAVAVVSSFTFLACGTPNNGGTGGGAGGGSGSCGTFTPQCSCGGTMTAGSATNGQCYEYAGAQYCMADGGSEGSGCSSMGPACATTNRVGTCWPPAGSPIQTATRYYSPTFTTATAQTDCMSKGCFIAN